MDQTSKIPQAARGMSLLDWLCQRFSYLDSRGWTSHLGEERLSLDGLVADGSEILKAGQVLVYRMPDIEEDPADLDYRLCWQDEWLLGINKPGNLLVHHQGRSFTHNLIHQIRHCHQPAWPEADCIHRLDRETSGLVLLSTSKAALKPFQELFEHQEVEKHYLAVVRGVPADREFTVDLPIGPAPDETNKSRQGVDVPGAKAACTDFRLLSVLPEGRSLVLATPHTGRTHQIRVHLASRGLPILGDKLYGMDPAVYANWIRGEKNPADPLLGWPRQALHCWRMNFTHPFTGHTLRLEADLPADMAGLLGPEVMESQGITGLGPA